MDSSITAQKLIAAGRFRDALAALGAVGASRNDDVLRLHAFERLGQYSQCRSLATQLLRRRDLGDTDTSSCEYVLGLIDWDEGRSAQAIEHMQRSVFRASRSRDIERMGWSQLRLWLMLANRADFDAATVVLAEARDLAFRLGDPSLLAAFHVAVSELDAKRGLLRTAGKHAASAMRLLAEHPNCWLEAWAENVQLAIALTESDLDLGLEHGHRAVALAEDSGVAVTLRACLAN